MLNPTTIWLTRPQADSEALASQLAAQGMRAIVAPVIEIVHQPLALHPLETPSALLLSSRHAAQALATAPTHWRNLPTYCVGEATAQAAEEQDFKNIIHGKANLPALLPAMTQTLGAGARLFYLAGEETRHNPAALLAAHAITVDTQCAYRAKAVATLPPELCNALTKRTLTHVVFFSPRSATLACDLLRQHQLMAEAAHISACCLSQNVADAAASLAWEQLLTCAMPTRRAMVDLLVSDSEKAL